MNKGLAHALSLTVLVLLTAIFCIPAALAQCDQCGTASGISCVNSTSYVPCNGNTPIKNAAAMSCPPGYYCTKLGVKCINDESQIACPDSVAAKGCGCASDDQQQVIACTSRNTFVICSAGAATTQTGSCPTGFVCNTDGMVTKKICVAEDCFDPICDRETIP